MLVVGHDHIDSFTDTPSLMKCSIHIVNQNWLGQLVGQKFRSGDKVLVNKISGSTSINHGFRGCFFHCVCCLQMDQEHNAFHVQFERTDDKLALYPFFPFRLAWFVGFGRQEHWCLQGFLCVFIYIWFSDFKNRKSITI